MGGEESKSFWHNAVFLYPLLYQQVISFNNLTNYSHIVISPWFSKILSTCYAQTILKWAVIYLYFCCFLDNSNYLKADIPGTSDNTALAVSPPHLWQKHTSKHDLWAQWPFTWSDLAQNERGVERKIYIVMVVGIGGERYEANKNQKAICSLPFSRKPI